MDRTILEAACKTLDKVYDDESQKLIAKLKQILEDALAPANLGKAVSVKITCPDYATIVVDRPGKNYGHDINIYFHRDLKTKKIEAQPNVGTFGSFGSNDKPEMNYYIAAGVLAAALPEIQKKIDAIDYAPFNKAQHDSWNAASELRKFDEEVRMAEHNKRVAEIESKLVVGTKIRVGYDWNKNPIYDEIARTTNKLIFLKEDYGSSTKKAHAITNLINKTWEFVG